MRNFKNTLNLNGINQIAIPMNIYTPENDFSISAMIEKQIYKFRLSVRHSYRKSKYYQIRNSTTNKLNNKSNTFYTKLKTRGKKIPKIGISYRKTFNELESTNTFKTSSEQIRLFSSARFLKNLNFRTNYSIYIIQNQNQEKNNYQTLNAYLKFKQKNKPLSFEISAQNILNNKINIKNYLSDYLVSQKKTYIFQRIIMLSLLYKI